MPDPEHCSQRKPQKAFARKGRSAGSGHSSLAAPQPEQNGHVRICSSALATPGQLALLTSLPQGVLRHGTSSKPASTSPPVAVRKDPLAPWLVDQVCLGATTATYVQLTQS